MTVAGGRTGEFLWLAGFQEAEPAKAWRAGGEPAARVRACVWWVI